MLTVLLAVAVAQAQPPVTLVEGGWIGADVDEKQVAVWTEVLFAELTKHGVQVRTRADIAQVIGLEREKQLMGAEGGVAEIAQALNADGLIRGSTGRMGTSLVLNVRVVSARGEPLAVHSLVVPSAEAAVAAMKPIADALVEGLAPRFPGRLAVRAKVTPGLRRFWWAPAAAALAFAGAGVGLQVAARGVEQDVRTNGSGYPSLATVNDAVSRGQTFETLSFVAFGVAGAALVGTGLLLWLGGDTEDSPAVALVPGPGSLLLVGRWP